MSLLMGHICISTYGVLERTLLRTEGSAALPSFQSLKTDDINVPPCLDRITLGFRINFILRLLCIPMSNSNDKMRLKNRRKNRSFNSYFFSKNNKFHGLSPSGSHHSLFFDQAFPKKWATTMPSSQSERHLTVFCINEIAPFWLCCLYSQLNFKLSC